MELCPLCNGRNNQYISYKLQADNDEDGVGNTCDTDYDPDNDGIQESLDNCPGLPNADQLDIDEDGQV